MPTPFTESLASEFKAELARQGKTAVDLARALGIAPETARAKLAGKAKLTDRDVDLGANMLGFSPFDFVARAHLNSSAQKVA